VTISIELSARATHCSVCASPNRIARHQPLAATS
jgi:hypothetical protein